MACLAAPGHLRLLGLAGLLAGGALSGACSPQVRANASLAAESTSPIEKPFAPGGRVSMRLAAGQYVIESRPDDKVHVAWTVRDPGDVRKARAAIGVEGAEARIETDGPNNGFSVRIGLPARSDLYVRLTAGEVTVTGIEGHKDVSAYAGEIRISVGDGTAYRLVDASVLAGEIQAAPFGGHKGGVFRTFDWTGNGTYELRAKLTAGDIQFRN